MSNTFKIDHFPKINHVAFDYYYYYWKCIRFFVRLTASEIVLFFVFLFIESRSLYKYCIIAWFLFSEYLFIHIQFKIFLFFAFAIVIYRHIFMIHTNRKIFFKLVQQRFCVTMKIARAPVDNLTIRRELM